MGTTCCAGPYRVVFDLVTSSIVRNLARPPVRPSAFLTQYLALAIPHIHARRITKSLHALTRCTGPLTGYRTISEGRSKHESRFSNTRLHRKRPSPSNLRTICAAAWRWLCWLICPRKRCRRMESMSPGLDSTVISTVDALTLSTKRV